MSFFFKKLTETVGAVTSSVAEAVKTVNEVASSLSLDNLQQEYGDPTGKRAMYEGLDFTYLTPSLIAMAFPATPDTKIRSRNDAAAVSRLLKDRHNGHYMVWNLSEEAYDYSLFDNQVIECHFPGFPAPPLGLLFKICTSIESWLRADKSNVAAIHCMTGKGRTAVVTACALAWLGEFSSPITALDYCCERRGSTVERMCVPSQLRYVQYFGHVLDNVKPRSGGLILRRIIMNGVPDMTLTVEQRLEEILLETEKQREREREAAARSQEGSGGIEALGSKVLDSLVALTDKADERLGEALEAVEKATESALQAASSSVRQVARGDVFGEGLAAAVDEGGAAATDGAAPPASTTTASTTTPVEGLAKESSQSSSKHGCRPYLQLFSGGKLIFSSLWQTGGEDSAGGAGEGSQEQAEEQLQWYNPQDGSIRFAVDAAVSGDVLCRVRHYGQGGDRDSMWRTSFHTGYTSGNVLRFSKRQLDVACSDPRVPDDFFIEFIFSPITREELGEASSAASAASAATATSASATTGGAGAGDAASSSSGASQSLEKGLVVSGAGSSQYEKQLEQEAAFWGDIDAKKRTRAQWLSSRGIPVAGEAAGAAGGASTAADEGDSGAAGLRQVPRSGTGPSMEEALQQLEKQQHGGSSGGRAAKAGAASAPAAAAGAASSSSSHDHASSEDSWDHTPSSKLSVGLRSAPASDVAARHVEAASSSIASHPSAASSSSQATAAVAAAPSDAQHLLERAEHATAAVVGAGYSFFSSVFGGGSSAPAPAAAAPAAAAMAALPASPEPVALRKGAGAAAGSGMGQSSAAKAAGPSTPASSSSASASKELEELEALERELGITEGKKEAVGTPSAPASSSSSSRTPASSSSSSSASAAAVSAPAASDKKEERSGSFDLSEFESSLSSSSTGTSSSGGAPSFSSPAGNKSSAAGVTHSAASGSAATTPAGASAAEAKGSSSSSKPAAAAAVDEDVDELERYLNSLA